MRPTLTREGVEAAICGYEKWVGSDVEAPFGERKKAVALEGKQLPCGKGCTRCCELMVTICSPDALRIAKHLKDKGLDTKALRQRLLGEVQFTFEVAGDKKTDAEVAKEYRLQRRNCVFIEDGGCSIYEARPVVCRLYNTVGPAESCQGDEADKQERIITNDLRDQAAQKGISFGKMAWTPEQGILPEMVLWALCALDNLEQP